MSESLPSTLKHWQNSHYGMLGLHPSASVIEIRQAYRDLSKLYHPDTTELPTAIATQKFQAINEAYATLSNPQQRLWYDTTIGYSRLNVIQVPANDESSLEPDRLAYISATERPLSSGELFALFILGVAFLGCLGLVIVVSLAKGATVL